MMLLPEALRNLAKRVFTRRYPRERPILPHGFRGKLLHYPERCIYCGLCAKYCPSNCITVDAKRKVWKHDVGQCLFCSQCVDTCRDMPKKDALAMGIEYELAAKDRRKLVWESRTKR